MGEALIVRRCNENNGIKIADGFPMKLSGGSIHIIPDLIGCNGFSLFALGSGSIGGNYTGHVVSVFYDGDTITICLVSSTSTSTSIKTSKLYRGGFDSTNGQIDLEDNSIDSGCAMQCIYW